MTTLTTNIPARPITNPFALVRTWIERVEARAELAQLDATLLEDCGVCLADIDAEVNKPFWRA